ncbi:MAG TPA: hypothetical protein VJT83_02550, partial [Chitinophagaceae bacterium]|nr:hypothetical protein [Chitinophagaceae bacterium]
SGKFPDREKYALHVPLTLKRIINKAIDPNPTARHSNVLQLINELSGLSDNLDWRIAVERDVTYWELERDDKKIKVSLRRSADGKTFNMATTKTMLMSGRETNVKAYTKEFTNTNYRSGVQDALRNLQ